jgi:Rieske 2Fe-2S family protein
MQIGVEIEGLEPSLAPGQARTLPGAAYTSAEVFHWERERLFEGGWPCVAASEQAADPGARLAVRVGNEGILLVRDEERRLRGFFNVCRHRAHELLEPGTTDRVRVQKCPYHAWVYGLDGALLATPRFDPPDGFHRSDHGLVPLPVVEWHGLVFANCSGDAPAFARLVGSLDSLVAGHEPERLRCCASHTYEVAANWKLLVENYHECYHCRSIHPELCRITPPDSGTNLTPDGAWIGGPMDLMKHAQTMSLDGRSLGIPLRGLDEQARRRVFYFGYFPNLLLSLHPDYVMIHRLEPLAPDHTRVECRWLFPPEALEQPGFDPAYAVEFWDLTNRQDWSACESVQRGVSSRGYRPGVLGGHEDAVAAFVGLVAGCYRRGGLEGVLRNQA